MVKRKRVEYQVLVLEGVRYAVLPERSLRTLCSRAGTDPPDAHTAGDNPPDGVDGGAFDPEVLAGRIAERRRSVGLTQAELARRAGIRIETLNRIERGRTTPDFTTIRKLVEAIKQAELSEAK